jgi:hypothetical protein
MDHRRALVARASARFATLTLATKTGLGLALAGAAAAGAGAGGVLPEPAADAARWAIKVVKPFEFPDRAAAARNTEWELAAIVPKGTGWKMTLASYELTVVDRLWNRLPSRHNKTPDAAI